MKTILMALAATFLLQAQQAPHRFVLPNGLRVLHLEDHDRPLVRLRLHVPMPGPPFSEKDKETAPLLMQMLDQADAGTRTFKAFEMAQTSTGLVASSSLSPEGFDWWFLARSRDQDRAMGLLADRLLRSILDPAALDSLPFEQVNSFRAQYLRPERAVLVIHGDLGLEQAKRLVTLNLGSWTAPRSWTTSGAHVAAAPPSSDQGRGSMERPPEDLALECEALVTLLLNGDPSLGQVSLKLEAPCLKATMNSPTGPAIIGLKTALSALRLRGYTSQDLQRAKAAWAARQLLLPLEPEALMNSALRTELGRMAKSDRLRILSLAAINGCLHRWLDPDLLRVYGTDGSQVR